MNILRNHPVSASSPPSSLNNRYLGRPGLPDWMIEIADECMDMKEWRVKNEESSLHTRVLRTVVQTNSHRSFNASRGRHECISIQENRLGTLAPG